MKATTLLSAVAASPAVAGSWVLSPATGDWVSTSATGISESVIKFLNTHTGEETSCALCSDLSDRSEVQKQLSYILRDWRTNEQARMDIGILEQLQQIQAKLGTSQRVNIISGYRSPETNEMLRQTSNGVAKHSYHTRGQAIDFNIPGVPLEQIVKAARSLQAGGVGYYPASGFVHIDTGPVRYWS